MLYKQEMISEVRRAFTILREEGIITLLKNTKIYLSRFEFDDGLSKSYQKGSRTDFDHRCQIISAELESEDTFLLDIGCAEGDLAAYFVNKELLAIGIERQSHVVKNARKRHSEEAGIGFWKYEITPDTVENLPHVDVIFLLTVYHHWEREFGDESQAMLDVISDKCNKLFFEVPEGQMDNPSEDVQRLFSDSNVKYLDEVEYKGGNRSDKIFLIK